MIIERLNTMVLSIVTIPSRLMTWVIGSIAGVLAPTFPFLAICMFAIVVDVVSAWRLSRRAAKRHPNAKKKSGKFRSEYAKRIFDTFFIISMCVILGHLIDVYIYHFWDLHLENWIAGGFAFVQLLSVLENESSENDATWAKTLQKVLINKVSRHLDLDEDIFEHHESKRNTHK